MLVVGAGHYVTGLTPLSSVTSTDKDNGVILPSLLALQHQNIVGDIFLAARDTQKLNQYLLQQEVFYSRFGWKPRIHLVKIAEGSISVSISRIIASLPKNIVGFVALPNHLHFAALSAFLVAEKDVFVVKPSVIKSSDLLSLEKLEDSHGAKVYVDYHKLFDPINLEIRRLLKGREITGFSSWMTQRVDMLDIYSDTFVADPEFNVNHYLGCHYIHLVSSLSRAKPLKVRAHGEVGLAAMKIKIPTLLDSISTTIIWENQDGSTFTSDHHSGWVDPTDSPSMTTQRINVEADGVRFSSDQGRRGLEVFSGGLVQTPNPDFFRIPEPGESSSGWRSNYGFRSIAFFLEEFTQPHSHGLSPWAPTLRDSREVTRVLELADRSLRLGSRWVSVKNALS